MQEGLVTNNGTNNVTFAVGETDQTATPGTGFYANGSSSPTPYAAFGTQFLQTTPLANTPATPASYTVQDGDTLESIAQAMWGDSSLWYKIADANGISDDSDLTVGESLTIPTDVSTVDNNSTTNTVYNTAQAIGNTSPTHPKPPSHHGGCGGIGEIILAVVAIAVAVVTFDPLVAFAESSLDLGVTGATIVGGALAGAAGSLVSQGVGLATGLQSKFNWAALGEAAIGGAIGGAIGPNGLFGANGLFSDVTSSFVQGLLRGVVSDAATQGIEVATGLQSKFNWADVAAAGIGGGVTAEVGADLHEDGWSATSTKFVSGMAGDIAYAATRTLINGSDFGDNIIQGLPQVIGSTIGGAIESDQTPAPPPSTPTPASNASDSPVYPNSSVQVSNLPPATGTVSTAGGSANVGTNFISITSANYTPPISNGDGPGPIVTDQYGIEEVVVTASRINQFDSFIAGMNDAVEGKLETGWNEVKSGYQTFVHDPLGAADSVVNWAINKGVSTFHSAVNLGGTIISEAVNGRLLGDTETLAQNGFAAARTGITNFINASPYQQGEIVGNILVPVVAAAAVPEAEPEMLETEVLASSASEETAGVVATVQSPIELAKAAQISSGYNADEFAMTTIPKGTLVYGGNPMSSWFTDAATIENSGLSQESLWSSLQVKASEQFGPRMSVNSYEVLQDIEVPAGSALANPDFGVGGGWQFYLERSDASTYFKQVDTINLH